MKAGDIVRVIAVPAVPALLLAILLVGMTSARADTVPLSGPFGYHSSDPSLLTVKLENKLDESLSVILHIPRSAVVFVSDFAPKDVPVLPDNFTVYGALRFALTFPDGAPFGEAVERWSIEHALSLNTAATALRSARAQADIRLIRPGAEPAWLFSFLFDAIPGFGLTAAPAFEGLRATELRKERDQSIVFNDDIVFYGTRADQFDYIQCSRSNRNSKVFCNYYLKVSDRASISATFVDFRFNGGRAFAIDRMRMIVKAYCTFADDPTSAFC